MMGKTRKRSKFYSFFSCLNDKSDDVMDEVRSTSTPTPSSPQPGFEGMTIKDRLQKEFQVNVLLCFGDFCVSLLITKWSGII